jgi:DNA-directed RNA polymerase subunit beta'
MVIGDKSYERVNDIVAANIQLASPNDIRSWSYGEVKKPETINYRSYRAEKDGLFCERIFGPERDWECFCGKYKGIKYKDIICDRCGVKITHSKVRRQRMGHINLAAPIVHVWFFRSLPNKLGSLLGLKTALLQQVIYFQRYIVIDPGETTLKKDEALTEEQYRSAVEQFGPGSFKALMGAEAIRDMVKEQDLRKLSEELRQLLRDSRSKQKSEAYVRRLRVINALLKSPNDPEWMIMDVIPVIPPDLRPLVPLESGNFATSDLNDLYRRVINRNNRLKKLLDLNAPGVIIRNEKRMLQQAVDALFDNGRCKRPVLGTGNRPLKSLTDMIKGKQGRFRENLLGKRVDYSARSVIVVGPELKLDQCGLPKKIALELFQPFIIRRLKEKGFADTLKSAKKILERKDEEVWDVLEEVTKGHPVLLNRAPTLHRMGIQAFFPVLVEGDSIMLHPLVCGGFNADFDGDMMAVHLPLSYEAQAEASMLMIATNNIFSPAHGNPVISPDLDMILGCYFLTSTGRDIKGEGRIFGSPEDAIYAYSEGHAHLRAAITVRFPEGVKVMGADGEEQVERNRYKTTVGRIIFNDNMPEGLDFYNLDMNGKNLDRVVSDAHVRLGRAATVRTLESMEKLGFQWATRSGLSFAASDLKVAPGKDDTVREAEKQVEKIHDAYQRGVLTEGERYNQTIDVWSKVREQVWEELMTELKTDHRKDEPGYINPIFTMFTSGARGNASQIGQLAGMRGLMAKPSGKIIEAPIKSNFREGLKGLEYFSSTHGARKGLADTALKTANSGYLTRKLVEVAQDVVITMEDCGTQNGITKGAVYRGEHQELSLAMAIRGRVARDNIVSLTTDEVVVRESEVITEEVGKKIEALNYEKIRVRSPLTCEAPHGMCRKCYGMDLSNGKEVEMGTAVGVIAAQSVGEPGTQLTMQTFHIGGVAVSRMEESSVRAKMGGTIKYHNLLVVKNPEGKNVNLGRRGELLLVDEKGREMERYGVPGGAEVKIKDGEKVNARKVLAAWDPHMVPILTEVAGKVRYEDIIEEVTMRKELDSNTGFERIVIIEHKGDHHPQLVIEDEAGKIQGLYAIPEKANLEADEGSVVAPGQLLAKTPRKISGSQDITAGLPRVTELFEARKPKDPTVISEVDGVVEFGDRKRGKRTILVKSDSGLEYEHLVPHGKHMLVHRGDRVRAGDRLLDGSLILHDVLRIIGEERLQDYMLAEIQKVYRSTGVRIDDKHFELLIRQMLRKVQIDDPGDTDLLPGDLVSKVIFKEVNDKVVAGGGKPAAASPVLLGISRSSLQSDSFLAAASFQETTKVLSDAAMSGRRDVMRGLKENVLMGHVIPAGTGFNDYSRSLVGRDAPPPVLEVEEEEEPEALVAEAGG